MATFKRRRYKNRRMRMRRRGRLMRRGGRLKHQRKLGGYFMRREGKLCLRLGLTPKQKARLIAARRKQRARFIAMQVRRKEQELLKKERKRALLQEYHTRVQAKREKQVELARLKRNAELKKTCDVREQIRAKKNKLRDKQAELRRVRKQKELARRLDRENHPETEQGGNGDDWIC